MRKKKKVPKLSRTRLLLTRAYHRWLGMQHTIMATGARSCTGSPSCRHDSPRQASRRQASRRRVEWKEEAQASTVTSDRIQLNRAALAKRCADKRPSAKVGSEAAAPRCDDDRPDRTRVQLSSCQAGPPATVPTPPLCKASHQAISSRRVSGHHTTSAWYAAYAIMATGARSCAGIAVVSS